MYKKNLKNVWSRAYFWEFFLEIREIFGNFGKFSRNFGKFLRNFRKFSGSFRKLQDVFWLIFRFKKKLKIFEFLIFFLGMVRSHVRFYFSTPLSSLSYRVSLWKPRSPLETSNVIQKGKDMVDLLILPFNRNCYISIKLQSFSYKIFLALFQKALLSCPTCAFFSSTHPWRWRELWTLLLFI